MSRKRKSLKGTRVDVAIEVLRGSTRCSIEEAVKVANEARWDKSGWYWGGREFARSGQAKSISIAEVQRGLTTKERDAYRVHL